MNRRSIAGVSHRTESHSLSEFTDAGAPLIRTWRRSGRYGCVPVPISTSPSLAATAKPPAAADPRHLRKGRSAKPAAGT